MDGQRTIDLARVGVFAGGEVTMRLAMAGLACFPTDTVYGVGGALRPEVGAAIVAAKGRAQDKPLQVIFPAREVLFEAVEFSAALRDVVLRLLPGPLTVVIPYPPEFDYPPAAEAVWELKGAFGRRRRIERVPTLGVRVPRWPEAARLLTTVGFPLVASSANVSGEAAPRTLEAVAASLRASCDLLLDGGAVAGEASTVVDFSLYEDTGRWRVLRPGAMSEREIGEALTRKREDLPRT
jgi:L-threonylcarbamoyladenylate synthase